VETNLKGRTSTAALERRSSSTISRVATTTVSSPPRPGWNLASEVVNSGMAFMHCRVEFK